jgi:hypothetical protein
VVLVAYADAPDASQVPLQEQVIESARPLTVTFTAPAVPDKYVIRVQVASVIYAPQDFVVTARPGRN